MTLGHEFVTASGTGRYDCHWLGFRFDAEQGFSPEAGESWIGLGTKGGHQSLMVQRGWMTGLWRTETRVWVSESSGRIYMNPSLELRKKPWQTFRVNATLQGVWGLRDDFVFAWGMNRGAPVAFFFDGKDWKGVDTPGFVCGVRGIRDDLIYAVGLSGLVARWDGAAFKAVQCPVDGNLSDIFIVSDDEMYASGTDGDLLTGSLNGWVELLQHDGMLPCVAKWHDTVWVGGGKNGLFQLVDEQLELYKPKVLAERFDVRESLLVTAPNAIIESTDGVGFQGSLVKALEEISAHEPPSWRP